MTFNGWVQIALFCVLLALLVRPLGKYMTRVFGGERTLLSPVLRPIEVGLYRICGVREDEEQHWVTYAVAMLFFSVAGFASLYALQRLQAVLPFNPQGQAAVSPDLAFNTSTSFVTNTNWQSYVPESTMSYLVQMCGLTVHNFVSAATGIALAIALIRGFARRSASTIGNFWVDMTRCTLYVLLPVSVVVGLFFVWQGVPQNLHAYTEATTLEGAKQVIAQGPVASQEVIKMFGTNGGGFFNVDSAAGGLQAGGNMEGKEVRFGIVNSALFTTVTTDASCGAVNTMHDSLLPLAGMIPMVNIMLGEIIFGGVGSGLYGMLAFAILAVFVAGLMVGRTPEYLGKKIEAKEVKMSMLAILILPLSILGFTALAVVIPAGTGALANAGPHGFSEALYAYTSATGNNGSAFAGLSANVPFWNVTLGIACMVGRFLFIIPVMAVAGSLAAKKIVPVSAGTFPTHGGLFVGLVIGTILIVGGLTFFPALALGPVVEHFAMLANNTF
jgi:K+-transporting ATPase ATPase A chain